MRGKTWILLATENAVPIHVTIHNAPSSGRPVEVFLVTDHPPEVLHSAQRGCQAAWAVAGSLGLEIPSCKVGFDLQGITPKEPISGESAGLAFGLALLQRQMAMEIPIAATGVVTSGIPPGPLEGVEGFREKCAAVERLSRELGGGLLFFCPRINLDQLGVMGSRRLEEAGVEVHPVASVEEAVHLLLERTGLLKEGDSGPDATRLRAGNRGLYWLAGGAAALLLGGGVLVYQNAAALSRLVGRIWGHRTQVSSTTGGAAKGRANATGPAKPGTSSQTSEGRSTPDPSSLLRIKLAEQLKAIATGGGLPAAVQLAASSLEGAVNCTTQEHDGLRIYRVSLPKGAFLLKGRSLAAVEVALVEPKGRKRAVDEVAKELADAVVEELSARASGRAWRGLFRPRAQKEPQQLPRGREMLKNGNGARRNRREKERGGDAGFE